MTLKNEIEKTMFKEGIEDRMQDIASLIDSPVEDVQKRVKTLSFSDYIKLMSAYKSNDADKIKDIMGLMEDIEDIAKSHTKRHTLPRIDTDKYQERDGLEGPIMTRSGKVVYYDPKAGHYYDTDTDMYLTYDEFKALDSKKMYNTGKVGEAYSTGSQGPDAGQEEEPSMADMNAAQQKLKSQRTQAMQRLGRDNLGGATAQMAANAIDKAEQGKVLTPIQRQALAHQAANLDNLAMNKDTRIQFRNLLNKLRTQQADQEGM